MVTYAGADYLKVDSCCGSQDHATAFSDYAKFRDAMNATKTPVYFSLCGWHDWYAPPDPSVNYTGGYSLGTQRYSTEVPALLLLDSFVAVLSKCEKRSRDLCITCTCPDTTLILILIFW